jgi:hypothetical protein
MEPAGELPNLLQARRELLAREVEELLTPRFGRLAKPAESEEHTGEALLGAVVEVALDALPLGVRDLDEARARGLQRLVGPHPVGDVAQIAGERGRARERDLGDRQLDRKLRSVAAHAGQLQPPVENHRPPALEKPREALAVLLPQPRRHDQLGHLPADCLAWVVAEDRCCGVVPADHAPSRVHGYDRVQRRFEHRPQPGLACVDFLLGVTPGDELADLAA